MAYTRSEPLRRWLGERADVLRVLAGAQANSDLVSGRVVDLSQPLARAYIVGLVSEFQGYCRELHDLALELLVEASDASPDFVPLLKQGLSNGRALDRGNPNLRTLRQDFDRLALRPLDLSRHNARWALSDKVDFVNHFRLRNVLVHGNDRELERLRSEGVVDTVSWARPRVVMLNRVARSLDRLVWDHLTRLFKQDAWR